MVNSIGVRDKFKQDTCQSLTNFIPVDNKCTFTLLAGPFSA